MLVRLLYASRAIQPVDHDMLGAILKQSRANNPKTGVTGVLCCCSNTLFLQALEGGRSTVNQLYHKISADPRHGEVMLLSYEEIDARRFASWSMCQVNLSRLNPAVLLKYSATAALDPLHISGKVAMSLLDELVATAAIVGQG